MEREMSKKTAKKKNVMVEENKVDKLLTAVFGDPQKKILRRLQRKVDEINDLSEKYNKMSDEKLKETFEKFKKSLSKKDLDEILPDVFALVREASTRVLGMRHFDVQLIGGMVLHEGKVAEMKTGEGKTLVATLPVALNAMEGKGVHVVTVNDYLAQRDASWMGNLYNFLGLSVGVIINDASYLFDPEYDNAEHEDENMRKLRPATRKEAYVADITYGTNNEFGFDYLRDNMVNEVDLLRQRELNFAIVDEVDSILIDEARTPLIISAPAAENPESYIQFAQIISQLSKDDYEVDEKRRSVALTESGIDKIEKLLNMKNLYTPEHSRAVYHVEQALRAETLFKRDKDYVVTNDGEVIIVDEHTGRLMNGRRYNEGLHQAIEAKEKVPVLQESMTLATISFQNFFRLYNKLSGMTGTAFTEAEEFQQIYSLEVVQIPSNKPVIRDDKEDLIFKTEKAKLKAVAEAIKEYHAQGRPVLVGSGSIEKNEQIAKYLDQEGIKYNLLNAKNNEHEAAIVARAGEKGAITLATNIAGRGTDIKLGKGVKELGGLVVIGSERHESRRIDNQFRGRGGRQGDPGETQFYVSTEDDLMRIFQGERIAMLMDRLGVPEDMPIQHKSVSKTLENAQKRVEGNNYDSRKQVLQYDDVLRKQREIMYAERNKVLENEVVTDIIQEMIGDAVDKTIAYITENLEAHSEKDETEEIIKSLNEKFLGQKPITDSEYSDVMSDDEIRELVLHRINLELAEKRELLGDETMNSFEKYILLNAIDDRWTDHIDQMDQLRKGIFLRSYGQIDPLREYKTEGYQMFEDMIDDIQVEVVTNLMRIRVERHEEIEMKQEPTNLVTNDSKEHIARGPIKSASREEKKARIEERKQRIKELKAQKDKETN